MKSRFKGDMEEDEVVSFGKETEAIREKLNEWNLRRDVVSIIGMGGLPKKFTMIVLLRISLIITLGLMFRKITA